MFNNFTIEFNNIFFYDNDTLFFNLNHKKASFLLFFLKKTTCDIRPLYKHQIRLPLAHITTVNKTIFSQLIK